MVVEECGDIGLPTFRSSAFLYSTCIQEPRIVPVKSNKTQYKFNYPYTLTAMASSRPENNLPKLSRFITAHDAQGKAIFHQGHSEQMPIQLLDNGGEYTFSLAYATNRFPAQLQNDEDVDVYSKLLSNPPGLVSPTGTVCRIVDFAPYIRCAMHRTVSLDYGVVLEGEVELILDSGETRIMKRGDVAVQRGTNHAWKNVTPDTEGQGSWARMLYFLSPAEPLELEGVGALGEVTVGIDVKAS